jgi:LPS O-antigen subunit length determinant protein (WzzB/FepE family)
MPDDSIIDHSTVSAAQVALAAAASDLTALQDRLAAINRQLPVPPDQEAMLEGEIPPDVATELSGCIDCLNDDILLQAVEMLQHAASVTQHDLVQAFHLQRERRRLEHR